MDSNQDNSVKPIENCINLSVLFQTISININHKIKIFKNKNTN
jgi:hypothetical protein